MLIRSRVKKMIASGIYDQNVIFNLIYPTYVGHYSKLRDIIAEVKNG